MSEYAPLRDAFHELNRLLIDKQQWDAEHEQRQQEQGLKRMMTESQLQDHALQRKSLELKSKEDELKMRPQKVNLYGLGVPNNGAMQSMLWEGQDPQLIPNIAKTFGASTIDRVTGDMLDDKGNPVMMANFEVGDKSPAALAFVHSAMEPTTMVNANMSSISSAIDERKTVLKGLADLPINAQKRGQIRGEISRLEADYKSHQNMLEPDGQIELLKKRQAVVDAFALQAVTNGANKNFTDLIKTRSENNSREILALQNLKLEREKARDKVKAENEMPMPVYAYKMDSEGNPTGESRLLMPSKKQLMSRGGSYRPMDIATDLDQSWTFDPRAKLGKEPKQPLNSVPWTNAFERERAGQLGKDLGEMGGIEIDLENVLVNQVSLKIAAEILPTLTSLPHGELLTIPTRTIADKVNSKARFAVDEYNSQMARIYFGPGNEDPELTKELGKPIRERFFNTYGVVGEIADNPYISKGAGSTKAPGNPATKAAVAK
jgi:hypothetical protein